MNTDGRYLRLTVLSIVGFGLMLPIVLGFWQTGRAAFGLFPALGRDTLSLAPWRELVTLPGFGTSLKLTLVTGIGATVFSLLLATGFCAAVHSRITPGAGARMLTPFLAIPHAALAVGLAFVLAPSGWIARGLAPFVGWDRPPDLATVNDTWGLALIVGLMIKEVPFLLLVILSALTQIPVAKHVSAGRSLGYGRGVVWIKIIMPQVWPMIRLPVWVVLAYALSVVDVAMILGPSNPPTLAVAITRWFNAADPGQIMPASAGAILQVLIIALGIAVFVLGECLMRRVGRWWLRRGGRGLSTEPGLQLASVITVVLMAIGMLAMLSLLIWSLAWRWPFPQFLPESWSLRSWVNSSNGWQRALSNTVFLAITTTVLSVALAIAWLEGEDRARRGRAAWAEALIYLPLVIPQVGFLYGLNIAFLKIGISGDMTAVIWAQALFVFPYVMIALSDPWRALNRRTLDSAASLGAGPLKRLVKIKLPILLRPILTATAIGVAVSVAQYLPTLFMGAGRIATLTTEAVTLSSGSDRRVTGVYAALQTMLPLVAYLAAFLIPAFLHRNRRDLNGTIQT
ncbi:MULTISPECIES: ABC transporter permease [Pacificibacter]|uniref:ABC transporter permease n=1 Tax=Pacificibacter TaxID=1042323 RepID=UPI001C09C757|nr:MULTISPECIES: ABC transporter permease subunit [Pacificibacter]MBU2934646.1 ABC transporter permease subunit [Pacificibacter marinus]MDO6616491.1 ABC transporter permease subunit [Pacificibacter sp. 1_MG-2023]